MNTLLTARSHAKKIAKESKIKIREALALVARENGFDNWKNYKNSMDTFWYQKSSPFLNQWFSQKVDAKNYRDKSGGFLLTYKGQYFVAEDDYILFLGLNPEDAVWKTIEFDASTPQALKKLSKCYPSLLK